MVFLAQKTQTHWKNTGFGHPAQHAKKRDSEGRPSCGLPSTRSTGVGGFLVLDWNVHWGHGWVLTHGHLALGQKYVPKMACPGKWKLGLQPAVQFLVVFILTYTRMLVGIHLNLQGSERLRSIG